MWITNGGFADVFIVFAKVDGEHFTAFIVERAFGGVTSGKEEHKMGLHGSSTTAVILQDVKVPAENLLGEVGKGHKVAFNVLNFGRFKLGAMCSGGAQGAIGESARYAAERKQFGQPIATFGAIKHKLGEMIARTYAVESLLYRTAGMIDARIDRARGRSDGSAALAAFEEYAVEASIAKVAGSESAELRPRREHPDSRRQRLRARLPGRAPLSRRAREPDFRGHQRDQPAADSRHAGAAGGEGRPADHRRRRRRCRTSCWVRPCRRRTRTTRRWRTSGARSRRSRKTALMVFGLAMQTYGEKLADEQEVLMHLPTS